MSHKHVFYARLYIYVYEPVCGCTVLFEICSLSTEDDL